MIYRLHANYDHPHAVHFTQEEYEIVIDALEAFANEMEIPADEVEVEGLRSSLIVDRREARRRHEEMMRQYEHRGR